MLANKVVVHDKEGRIVKGTTADFLPKKPNFHLMIGGLQGGEVEEVFVKDLKAVFFVKDYDGNPNYNEVRSFGDKPKPGRKVKVAFQDGETMFGNAQVINYDQPGFFLIPADPNSNNDRVYAVFSSIVSLEVNGTPVDPRRFKK